jgi:hypothetical protein
MNVLVLINGLHVLWIQASLVARLQVDRLRCLAAEYFLWSVNQPKEEAKEEEEEEEEEEKRI